MLLNSENLGGIMKKLLIILLVAIVTLGCVFAQGAEETGTKEPTKLVVWSAAAEDETQALIHKFNESYPNIDVQMIAAGSNELKTKLMAEQPKPSGDVIMGIAKETYDEFYDYFVGYVSKNIGNLSETVRDKAAEPRYYGFSMPLQCFIINTDKMAEADRPLSWKDLIDPKYKGDIIMANPALSGSAYAQVYMMYKLYGDEFLEKLAKNAIFVASSKTVPESVARGEYSIGVTGESNVAKYIEQGTAVSYIYPLEGTGARFDASGIVKNSPNLEAAKLFIDFLTSEEAYVIIHDVRNRRVVVDTLPGPQYLPSLKEINLFDYDAVEAADMREDLTERFTEMMV